MRNDARALLEKLSRQDFRYKQFEDPYTDMELWPVFEALLKDERISGKGERREEAPRAPEPRRPAAQARRAPQSAKPAGSFLGQYSAPQPSPANEPGRAQTEAVDLRRFLGKLGQAKS
ncbi:hypothetical protein [Hyphomonas pacifica]|uniref:Uncharacterized protein n=1 Tax=Hyphomonas pacifica TaxID=1280941 RepID=A0A062TYW0_9PROT|nr:hypothetical protein [Hyphomonas pacifica]KCZ47445.1 hypothetical protein HY2_04835 [Hyphomonas pacifica]RAN31362.1 hypothetical protein HY3_04535 [Hyphomonas pacifica]RAN38420.1 hypothetical protein HY11_00990 [Hyphomonas pacifica]